MRFTSVSASAVLLLACSVPAQRHIRTFHGESALTFFGTSIDLAGDVDGDGYPDILAGAPGLNSNGTIASTIFVWSGKHGGMIHCRNGDFDGDKFGQSIAGIGDVDGDGRADFAVGLPRANYNGKLSGSVRVYSGRTYAVITTIHGGGAGEQFGTSLTGLGDIDGDGRGDFAVGGPGANLGTGVVRVISGRRLTTLYAWNGTTQGSQCGHTARLAGDVDADGIGDVIFGAPASGAGYAEVRSGRDGSKILALHGLRSQDGFGFAVAGIGDIDRDGHDDVAIGAPTADTKANNSGRVQVYSGKTRKLMLTIDGDSAGDLFGSSIAGLGDFDRDGAPDFAIGAVGDARGGAQSGSVFAVSGKTHRSLGIFTGSAPGDLFGSSIAAMGDANRDGHADFLVGAIGDDSIAKEAGSARLISGAPLTLESDRHIAQITKGAQHTYRVHAGAANAGRMVLVVGSMSDIGRGFSVGNVRIPVQFDAYTTFTVGNPNLMAGGKLIPLDRSGEAKFTMTLPMGLSTNLQRTVLYHSAVVLSTNPIGVHMATNPVTMVLVR